MNTHSTFVSPIVAGMSFDDVIEQVSATQANASAAVSTYNRRAREEFAQLMLDGRAFIKQVQANVSLQDQAKLLTRHQIKAASRGTSAYTPWIKLLFGKHDPEGKTVAFGGEKHVKWISDASFGRYFNFFEFLDREFQGEEEELLEFVLEQGGPATIVKNELERKRNENAPSEEQVKQFCDVFLAETTMPIIDLPSDALEGTEEFVSVMLRKTDAGICLVAVTKKDAQSDFQRLAADKFDELEEARAAREAAAEEEKRLLEAHERGVNEGAERLAAKMGMSVEEMRLHLQNIKAKLPSTTVDKAVG